MGASDVACETPMCRNSSSLSSAMSDLQYDVRFAIFGIYSNSFGCKFGYQMWSINSPKTTQMRTKMGSLIQTSILVKKLVFLEPE